MTPFRFLCAAALLCLTWRTAAAQPAESIGTIFPDEALAGAPVTLAVHLRQGAQYERVDLLFRAATGASFTRLDMPLTGNTASATIPSRYSVAPFIEYYFVLTDRSGRSECYPPGVEGQDPYTVAPPRLLQLPIRAQDDRDEQIVFLSPDPGSVQPADELLISISLLRADSLAVKRSTQIFIDGANVTAGAVFTGDLIVLLPENTGRALAPGPHRLNVRLYSRDGTLYRTAQMEFVLRGEVQYALSGPVSDVLDYNGTVNLESRSERVAGTTTWYHRGGYQISARQGSWRLISNGFATSDEATDRQPQNRFFFGAEHPLFRIGYGDAYPSAFPDVILSGRRIRGLHSAVRLGAVNLDLALGSTQRAVEGRLVGTFPSDSLQSQIGRDSTATYGQVDAQTWGKYAYGTYARNLLIVRPSFGSGEQWQFGLTWLSAKDDLGSIRYGVRPQENVVAGADVLARFDGSRIELKGEAAFSAFNSDISSGTITDDRLRDLFPNDYESLRSARDILRKVITANEYLRPLSLKKPSTIAYDVTLGLRYFDNALRATYLFRGNDYTSFGQTYLRKDIQGFTLQDRARLIGNELFLTVGYERLTDNTGGTKVATSTYQTVSVAASYLPSPGAPGFTAGFSRFTTANGLPPSGADSLSAFDDATNRIFVQSSFDLDWLEHHTVTAGVSVSRRADATVRRINVENTIVNLSVQTRYAIPLQTVLDLSVNGNTLPAPGLPGVQERLDFTALTLSARYGIVPDVLTGAVTVGPTFGDLRRTVVDVSAEWFALQTLSVVLEYSYFRNSGLPSDGFASLRTRYDL